MNDEKAPSLRLPRFAVVAASLVALNGLIALVEALLPKPPGVVEWMLQWVPVEVIQHSRLLLALSGLSLLLLARGLLRRKHMAWTLAVGLMVVLLLSHLGRAFDWHHALITFAIGALLVRHRGEFFARSDQPSLRRAIRVAPAFFTTLLLFAFLGLHRIQGPRDAGRRTDLLDAAGLVLFRWPVNAVATQRDAAFCQSIQAGTVFAALFSLGLILRPVVARYRANEGERARVREIIDKRGDDPMDEFALLEDKLYFFACDSVVAYALWRDIAVALASPIGPRERTAEAIAAFRTFCAQQDWHPVFSQFPAAHLALYESQGFSILKIAEDARIDLGVFTLQGGKFQNIRTSRNKANKAGMTVRWHPAGSLLDEAIEAQLAEVSDEWLGAKHGREMTFDLGQFSREEIRRREVSYALDADGRVEAFTTWLPYARGEGRCIDLMRARREARGVMDYLITESLLDFRERGVREASLGNAPLANTDPETLRHLPDKAVTFIYEHFNQVYSYKSLFEFKEKYHPQWRSRYLAYSGPSRLPLAAVALTRVHMTAGFLSLLRS